MICAIGLTYTNVSIFHTILNICYHSSKKQLFVFNGVVIWISGPAYKFLWFGFDVRYIRMGKEST